MSSSDWAFLGNEASRLVGLYPISSFSDINSKYTEWDNESFEISKTFVYEGITENTLPSDAYLANGKIIAEKQLVKAGYRIALTLESMWGNGNSAAEVPSQELFL